MITRLISIIVTTCIMFKIIYKCRGDSDKMNIEISKINNKIIKRKYK